MFAVLLLVWACARMCASVELRRLYVCTWADIFYHDTYPSWNADTCELPLNSSNSPRTRYVSDMTLPGSALSCIRPPGPVGVADIMLYLCFYKYNEEYFVDTDPGCMGQTYVNQLGLANREKDALHDKQFVLCKWFYTNPPCEDGMIYSGCPTSIVINGGTNTFYLPNITNCPTTTAPTTFHPTKSPTKSPSRLITKSPTTSAPTTGAPTSPTTATATATATPGDPTPTVTAVPVPTTATPTSANIIPGGGTSDVSVVVDSTTTVIVKPGLGAVDQTISIDVIASPDGIAIPSGSGVVRVVVKDGNGTLVPRQADVPIVVLVFQLGPLDVCLHRSCRYYDGQTRAWLADGCTTNTVNGIVQCSCTHLTDFAVLNYRKSTVSCYDSSALTVALAVFVGVYVLVAVAACAQFTRAFYGIAPQDRNMWVTIQHCQIALVCLVRMVSLLSLLGVITAVEDNVYMEAFISALPYMLLFSVFSLLVGQWRYIINQNTPRNLSEDKVFHRNLLSFNLFIGLLCVILFVCAMETGEAEAAAGQEQGHHGNTGFIVGASVLAVMWLVTGVAFCVYANLMAKKLQGVGSTSAGAGAAQKAQIVRLFTRVGYVVVFCFVCESISSVLAVSVGVFDVSLLAGFTVVYLFLDALALVTVISLYYGTVNKMRARATEGSSPSLSSPSSRMSQVRKSKAKPNVFRAPSSEVPSVEPRSSSLPSVKPTNYAEVEMPALAISAGRTT